MNHYFDKYIFIAPGSDYGRAMWSDLEKNERCVFLEFIIGSTNHIIRLLHHIHFSFGINNRFRIPFQQIWKKSYSLNNIDFEDGNKYCIILPDVSACRIDLEYLNWLKKKDNVKLVLVNVNVIKKKEKLLMERWGVFAEIFSFDKSDCEKYGCIYHPTIYSLSEQDGECSQIYDAFFIGSYTKERYKKLLSLYTAIKDHRGIADFHIIGVPQKEKRIEGIYYNTPLSYDEVVRRTKRSNCVIEIMNPGQKGLTLRAMEAICNNKKLLTDNATVMELPYFKTGYIKYMKEISSDDATFSISKEKVDYRYRGDFSPNRLIERIEETFLMRQNDEYFNPCCRNAK